MSATHITQVEAIPFHLHSQLKFSARKLYTSLTNSFQHYRCSELTWDTHSLRKRLKLTPGELQRAEAKLTELGLLTVEISGDDRYYSRP